jgi:dTDP-4-amino-4,6-dideoxy-D-galactose acyltransferase
MTDSTIEPLDWDSGHYGMPVGRITLSHESPDALDAALASARARGIRLLYWLSSDTFSPDKRTLSRFGGQRIVGGCRYRRALLAQDPAQAPDHRCVSVTGGSPDSGMRDLALLAGRCSRFRLDTRLRAGRFEAMYEQWMARSLSGDLADEVLVLRDADGATRSLLTYRLRDTTASIGLVATSPSVQGQGFGSAMLVEAHRRTGQAGAKWVEVWTQSENEAACRLYESSGYALADRGSHYHFLTP